MFLANTNRFLVCSKNDFLKGMNVRRKLVDQYGKETTTINY